MTSPNSAGPADVCETVLRQQRANYQEKRILRSEIEIIDQLLARRFELLGAYSELHRKLARRDHGLETFFFTLTSTAAFWSPKRILKARDGRTRLCEINQAIAETGHTLAALLDEREALNNDSGFSTGTHYHVLEVVAAAARGNPFFESFARSPLRAVWGRFDMKYWPSIGAFVEVVARDASEATPSPNDPLTAAATSSRRGSLADFFKALFVAIKENSEGRVGHMPVGFRLTDNSLASLANCALDLDADTLVDGSYVKRLRQRAREASRAQAPRSFLPN